MYFMRQQCFICTILLFIIAIVIIELKDNNVDQHSFLNAELFDIENIYILYSTSVLFCVYGRKTRLFIKFFSDQKFSEV